MTFRVGVVGGGQLARMMIPPAVELGIEIAVLAEQPDSAARLAATQVGDYRNLETVRQFAQTVDVITFDHEHVPQPVLQALESDGVAVRPGSAALEFAQDKLAMRRRLSELGLPMPAWAAVRDQAQIRVFLGDHGGRAVLKTPRGGYDGHGVRVITDPAQADDWLSAEAIAAFDGELLIEEVVDFSRELSQLGARSATGEFAEWALVESIQRNGVCNEVFAPAPQATPRMVALAAELAERIATELGVVGVLAVELFETEDNRILINELAMRPHNTGHWTMDGAVTGQFEQHLRAVLGLALGSTAMIEPTAVMMNVLGGPPDQRYDDALRAALRAEPRAKVHFYGKEYRPGRKVGHVNVIGTDLTETVLAARHAASLLV